MRQPQGPSVEVFNVPGGDSPLLMDLAVTHTL